MICAILGIAFLFIHFILDNEINIGNEMDTINRMVVNDAIEQFKLTLQGGDPIEICVYAGMVTAAYLQAKDQEGYVKAKENEKRVCKAAGLDY